MQEYREDNRVPLNLSHLGRKGAVPQTVNEENKRAGLEILTVLRSHVPGTCQNLVLANCH